MAVPTHVLLAPPDHAGPAVTFFQTGEPAMTAVTEPDQHLAAAGHLSAFLEIAVADADVVKYLLGTSADGRVDAVRSALAVGVRALRAARDAGEADLLREASGEVTATMHEVEATVRNLLATAADVAEQSTRHTARETIAEVLHATTGPGSKLGTTLDRVLDPERRDGLLQAIVDAVEDRHTQHARQLREDILDRVRKDLSDASRRTQEGIARVHEAMAAQQAADATRRAVTEKSSAKGTAFEQVVSRVLSTLVAAADEHVRDVSQTTGASGSRKGDHVVDLQSPTGSRIVVEDKTEPYSEAKIRKEAALARENWQAEQTIWVVDSLDKVPNGLPVQRLDERTVVAAVDPQDVDSLALATAFADARLRIARDLKFELGEDNDVAEAVAAASQHLDEMSTALRRITTLKSHLTQAKNNLVSGRGLIDEIQADCVDAGRKLRTAIEQLTPKPGGQPSANAAPPVLQGQPHME